MKYKTGLVFSAGGTRGFAHIGVLKALEEAGISKHPAYVCIGSDGGRTVCRRGCFR